jgi:hypothetical protein
LVGNQHTDPGDTGYRHDPFGVRIRTRFLFGLLPLFAYPFVCPDVRIQGRYRHVFTLYD